MQRLRDLCQRWFLREQGRTMAADALHAVHELSPTARSITQRFANLETSRNRHFFRGLAAHLAGSHDDPCLAMYFNFALSANERGGKAADLINAIAPLKGKQALDVGCAYGGFLVGLAKHGAEPTGFDIDASLLSLGEHNFRDVGRRFPTHLADVTSREDIERFQRMFDVITCNDVIEHVSDPAIAIEHIGSMLRSGGLAYFEIPNRDAVSAVISDGHYQLFGITQLDREMAGHYYAAHAPGTRYGVEHYLRLPEYRALFERAGLSMELRPDASVPSIQSVRDSLAELRRTLATRLEATPAAVRAEIEHAVGCYLDGADTAPIASADDRQQYLTRYGTAFWRVIARKPPTPSASGRDPIGQSSSGASRQSVKSAGT